MKLIFIQFPGFNPVKSKYMYFSLYKLMDNISKRLKLAAGIEN